MAKALTTIVDPRYRHVEKVAVPAGTSERMKWYDLREARRVIDPVVRDAARKCVDNLVGADDVGFVILHLCGDTDVYLLLICRWRNDNEIWETVFVARTGEAFVVVVADDPTRATYCVWELGIVNSERLAWATFLRSDRDEPDLDSYLRSTYSGVV